MLEPECSFSIPSVHDSTPLDCRIYLPKNIAQRQYDSGSYASIRAAVVAHPYAPLGGCFNDAVVLSVTQALRREGFIVGTFNFRGAAGSSGSTSLTGKAEQADYESFIGFLITYCQHLMSTLSFGGKSKGDAERNRATKPQLLHGEMVLLLAGYSYGSLVLARLQPISIIATRFQQVTADSVEAEIVSRARSLSVEFACDLEKPHTSSDGQGREEGTISRGYRANVSPITVGDEQTHHQKKRLGHIRRSTDVERQQSHPPYDRETISHFEPSESNERNSAFDVSARYLLISPVILPFTHSICPPGSPSIMLSLGRAAAASSHRLSFLDHPTLAIFGDKDVFTSSSRLRAWAEKQSQESQSSFTWAEIIEAGHFWREEGAMQALQQRVVSWSKSLAEKRPTHESGG